MQTYFIEKEHIDADGNISVGGDLYRHLTKVLRVRKGEYLRFSDGTRYHFGAVSDINKDLLTVAVTECRPIDDEPALTVTLIQCLPRGDKMEQIIQKCTELGVARVIPVESDNSQIRIGVKGEQKRERWQKIAAAAAEQSGRGIIPAVSSPTTLREALASLAKDTCLLFCYEREEEGSFRATLQRMKAESRKIAVVIGPEGGFSPAEAALIVAAGGEAVTMGSRVLRVETAGPAALAVLMYEFEEWEVQADDH